ncbi:hypothetical protein BKA93DRAFT_692856, partial [Sparassis latifolia]
ITNTVISGSLSLVFFDVTCSWSPNNADFYVLYGHFFRIVQYLVQVEGYTLDTNVEPPYSYSASIISQVARLRRGRYHIDVIRSFTESPLCPLPLFWSTHVMNYLSADSFCCAYPDSMLQHRGLLNPHRLVDCQYPSSSVLSAMFKYIAHGYDFR